MEKGKNSLTQEEELEAEKEVKRDVLGFGLRDQEEGE
jgi:hypothetical protein